MKLVTCNSCGWVHMGLTRAEVEREVTRFNVFYDNAPLTVQKNFGNRRSHIDHYTLCFRCGGPYINFSMTKEGTCLRGSTIQPILLSSELERDNPS